MYSQYTQLLPDINVFCRNFAIKFRANSTTIDSLPKAI